MMRGAPRARFVFAGLIAASLIAVSLIAVSLIAVSLMLALGPRISAQEEPKADGTSTEESSDPMSALAEGNRLFRDGLIAEAADAYRAGYDPTAPHPTLVYNLGTTLHHLDRLPEAILWYRRGETSADPWLEENLWLARRTLGSQVLPASGALNLVARHGTWLRIAAVACAWLALAAWIVAAHRGRALSLALFVLAVTLYGTAIVGGRWGSAPAVLLEDCATTAGDLPAGTEVWAKRLPNGDWRIAARSEEAICEAQAVAPIRLGSSS